MSETYQPTPFKQRPSQKITAWDYTRKVVPIFLLPIALGVVGLFVGRQIKPDVSEASLKKDAEKSLLEQMIFGRSRLQALADGNYGNVFKNQGFVLGSMISAFLAWRRGEKKRLEVAEVVESVKDIAPLHQTNEDIEKDNQLVKKMIAFEQEKQKQLQAGTAPYQKRLEMQDANANSLTM